MEINQMQMQGAFYLPKGTIVKHGTSLCRLPGILKNGLVPGAERQEKRQKFELAPEIPGVYVGNLISYFGAYVSYTSELGAIFSSPTYRQAAELCATGESRKIKTLDIPSAPKTLPVVLRVVLEEDCLLYADEDFVDDGNVPADERIPEEVLLKDAQHVWERWQSGCINSLLKKTESSPGIW
jgi:hypothetical protein